jgi:hypothetical protein
MIIKASKAGRRSQRSGWFWSSLMKDFSASPRASARMMVKAPWKKLTVWMTSPRIGMELFSKRTVEGEGERASPFSLSENLSV